MLPTILLVQWLPIPVAIPSMGTEDQATALLGTTLTVVGAVQALAIAVIVFAAQAYANSRYGKYGGSLTGFARNTGLLLALNFGIAALIADGLSFFGFGSGAPGGWAGTWSVILSGLFILLLPFLYWRTLRETDPARMNESRLERARQLAQGMAWDNATLHLADSAIAEHCEGLGVERDPFRLSPTPDDTVVLRAPRAGQVKDISLKAITKLAELGRTNSATMTILVALTTTVHEGQPLAAADQVIATKTPRPWHLVKVGLPKQTAVLSFLDGLHEEALDAIRSGRPSWYQSVADTYVEYTLGPARRVAEFGLPIDAAYGIRTAIFARTPLERVSHYMYEELVVAVTGRARETAFDAIYLPRRIAQEAAGLGATTLFQEMTRLYPAVYAALTTHPDAPLKELMGDRAWRHLVAIIEYPIGRDLRETTDPQILSSRIELASMADRQVMELLRQTITAADRPTFDGALARWTETLAYWEPEHARPSRCEVDRLRAAHGETEEVQEAETLLRFSELAVKAKTQLTSDRNLWLFGLAMWALRAARRESGSPAGQMFMTLQGQLRSRDALLGAANRALGGIEDHSFSGWIIAEQPERTIHVGGADDELLAAFVATLLVRVESNQLTELPPLEWLPHRLARGTHLVNDLTADDALMSTLHIPDPEGTGRRLIALLEDSVQAQQNMEEERERQLVVPDDARHSLKRYTAEAWNRTRFVSRIFEAIGQSEPAASADDVTDWAVRIQVPKMFLQIEREDDLEHFGSDMGRALSRGELGALLRAVSTSPSTAATRSDLQAQTIHAVREMRNDGYEPTIMLLPVDWRLHENLQLDWRPEGHPPPPGDLGLQEGVIAQHLGPFEEVPAFFSAEADDRHIYVIDFVALGTWHFGRDEEQQTIAVEVMEFDDQKAHEATEDEAQALELMKSALIAAHMSFEIDIKDPNAVRIIHITDEPPRIE